MASHAEADYPVLADTQGKVVREYGVFDLLGDGVSAPATFIIGADRVVRWKHIGQDIADRPQNADLLRLLSEIGS